MSGFDLQDVKRRMTGAIQALKNDLASLRTGRASPNILDPVEIDAYGAKMPLAQVATVSVPEPRLLSVQVWDRGMVQMVEKAIRESSLGLNPQTEGQTIRVPIPELSTDRRKELTKVAHQYAEKAKVAVRNVRRDGMELLKRLEKEAHMSEDEHRQHADEVQKATDQVIKDIDEALQHKDAEIMQV